MTVIMTDIQRDRLLVAIARGLMLSLGSGRFSEDSNRGQQELQEALRGIDAPREAEGAGRD